MRNRCGLSSSTSVTEDGSDAYEDFDKLIAVKSLLDALFVLILAQNGLCETLVQHSFADESLRNEEALFGETHEVFLRDGGVSVGLARVEQEDVVDGLKVLLKHNLDCLKVRFEGLLDLAESEIFIQTLEQVKLCVFLVLRFQDARVDGGC